MAPKYLAQRWLMRLTMWEVTNLHIIAMMHWTEEWFLRHPHTFLGIHTFLELWTTLHWWWSTSPRANNYWVKGGWWQTTTNDYWLLTASHFYLFRENDLSNQPVPTKLPREIEDGLEKKNGYWTNPETNIPNLVSFMCCLHQGTIFSSLSDYW